MPQENNAPESVESLPEWAQKIITDLRTENGTVRTRAKTAEGQVTDLTSQVTDLTAQIDQHTTAATATASELAAERFGRTRDRLAAERGIPLAIAESLSAADEATLTASLDALATLRGAAVKPPLAPNPAQSGDQVLDAAAQAQAEAEAFFSNLN